MVSAAETAQAYIANNPVMVFSKSYCPSCSATKTLLARKQSEIGFQYKVIEMDQMGEEGAAIQDALEESTGRRTVPNIFINKKSQGGNDQIQAMGPELDRKLRLAAEAKPSTAVSDSPATESS